MTRQLLFILMLTIAFAANAQEFNGGVSYQYISATQWNKIIQTYNFSRPFMIQKQPLFSGGGSVSFTKLFTKHKHISSGVCVSYAFVKSKSTNENFINTLNLHFINIGYTIRYGDIGKTRAAFGEISFSAATSGLFRNVNGASFIYDDAKSKAFGIGGNINFKAGYWINVNKKFDCAPYLNVGYCPYLYSPNTEVVINETHGLIGNNHTGIFNAQIGLMIRKHTN